MRFSIVTMKGKLVSLFIVFALLFFSRAFSQSTFPVKLMCWNLLNYPDASNAAADTTLRHPFYRAVIQYEAPDILVTEENTSLTATTWFLNSVMNVNGTTYSRGYFINGFDTDNEIYFKTAAFSFVSNTAIHTDVRDINEFKLVHILTGDTIRIYAVHLKASAGSPNDAQRASEVDSLRQVTNLLNPGSNFIVCGDFNIYGDYEPAYQKLLQNNINDDGNFIDPITMTGTWHNYAYRAFHTQSTRVSGFGGGASGGLNDRFDMILFSTAIHLNASGIGYVAASTTPVGNDGNHYNDDINLMPNTAAPSNVINALYNASDHLPVYAIFNFTNPTGMASMEYNSIRLDVFPDPARDHFIVSCTSVISLKVMLKITDMLGRDVMKLAETQLLPGTYEFPVMKKFSPGIYDVILKGEEWQLTKKLLIYQE